MAEIYKNESHYVLVYREDPSGRLLLETFCGTSGIYSVAIELTDAEASAFAADPSVAIRIAQAVCDDPDRYKSRCVDDQRLAAAR